MGYETFTKCVATDVYPVLDYGSEVWGGIKNATTDNDSDKYARDGWQTQRLCKMYYSALIDLAWIEVALLAGYSFSRN